MSRHLPIMPKEVKPARAQRAISVSMAPYAISTTENTSSLQAQQRNAAIWSSADDDVLLQARASGLNWHPIAARYFPNKTPNACRKRHERLIERRQIEDWDQRKLEFLAREYLACREEMWDILARRVGERWAVVEAKCMEKGIKGLQITARTANRKASAVSYHHSGASSFDDCSDGGISSCRSDSGVGFGSDAEMAIGGDADEHDHIDSAIADCDEYAPSLSMGERTARAHQRAGFVAVAQAGHIKSSSWDGPRTRHPSGNNRGHLHASTPSVTDHSRTRSLPQPLPLYQPPPPINTSSRSTFEDTEMMTSPEEDVDLTTRDTSATQSRYSPSSNGRGGISIQSVLST